MKIKNHLLFSPNYKFIDLNWDDQDTLINAFKDRVEGFYLKPAKLLNCCEYAFAAGALCVIMIDFLAKIETGCDNVGKRFKYWVKSNFKEFVENDKNKLLQTLAYRLYKEFRNGLVHEGRIKNAGQFSYDFDELVKIEKSVMIINPDYLLKAIISSFKNYISKLKNNKPAFDEFKKNLDKNFEDDKKYIDKL